MRYKKIKHEGSNINYLIAGKGDAVVLLHGFGEDHTIWAKQVDHLSNSFLVIAPDIFGSGDSELLSMENPSIEDFAKGIKTIIKYEGISQFVMIGHSMGGYITLAYEKLYPYDLIAFGLFHSTAFADHEIKKSMRNKSIEFIKQFGSEKFLSTSIPGLFYNESFSQNHVKELISKGGRINPTALIQFYLAIRDRKDSIELLSTTSKPVLMLSGIFDKAVPYMDSLHQSYLSNITYFFSLKFSAHMGMLEEPERSNEILSFF
jgi:pimeloyl-ACP methyl ester carboxylesterase